MYLALLLVLLGCICVVACIATGCWLCVTGVRGRMLDTHPYCRTCGYDLIGHCPRPDTCIECGSTLRMVGAVRIGRRVIRPERLVIGVMMLGICLLPLFGYRANPPAQALPVPQVIPAPVQTANTAPIQGTAERDAIASRRPSTTNDGNAPRKPATDHTVLLGAEQGSTISLIAQTRSQHILSPTSDTNDALAHIRMLQAFDPAFVSGVSGAHMTPQVTTPATVVQMPVFQTPLWNSSSIGVR